MFCLLVTIVNLSSFILFVKKHSRCAFVIFRTFYWKMFIWEERVKPFVCWDCGVEYHFGENWHGNVHNFGVGFLGRI